MQFWKTKTNPIPTEPSRTEKTRGNRRRNRQQSFLALPQDHDDRIDYHRHAHSRLTPHLVAIWEPFVLLGFWKPIGPGVGNGDIGACSSGNSWNNALCTAATKILFRLGSPESKVDYCCDGRASSSTRTIFSFLVWTLIINQWHTSLPYCRTITNILVASLLYLYMYLVGRDYIHKGIQYGSMRLQPYGKEVAFQSCLY